MKQTTKTSTKTLEPKITTSAWYPEKKLLVTNLSGDLDKSDIILWEKSLKRSLNEIEDSGRFKILINIHGFKALNVDAHKRFRHIIPATLAQYGWKVGYSEMFEEEGHGLELSSERNIRCVAAAHCHQDEGKMALYESRFGRANERYFADPEAARAWIEEFHVA